MSSKNLSFAADILEATLKDNRELQGDLEKKEDKETKRSEQIVDYVKHFVKLRLAKSKTKQEKEALHLLMRRVPIIIPKKIISIRFVKCLASQLVRFIETYKNKAMD